MRKLVYIALSIGVISALLLLWQQFSSNHIVQAQSTTITISEIMASNSSIIADEDGEYSDWIEIHNSSSSTINLQGYTLSDDINTLDQWSFPSVSLNANQYLIVFASGKNRASAGSELHTNFKLSAGRIASEQGIRRLITNPTI